MGRGPITDKAQRGARSLLFGPRTATKSQASIQSAKIVRKDMEGIAKKKAKNQRKKDYLQSWDKAFDRFSLGDVSDLISLVTTPAPHGLKTAEKQGIELAGDRINNLAISFSDPSSPVHIDAQSGQLKTILQLRDRIKELNLPDNVSKMVGSSFTLSVLNVSNQTIKDELVAIRHEIGPLPKTFTGADWQEHFIKDGKSICSAHIKPYPSLKHGGHPRPNYSVVSLEVDCKECLGAYQQDQALAETLTPDQWASNLQDVRRSNWDEGRDNLGFYGEHSFVASVQDHVEYVENEVRQCANNMISAYSKVTIRS